MIKLLTPVASGFVCLTLAGSASAWYFPEHAEFARMALEEAAPPTAAASILLAVDDANQIGLALCKQAVVRTQEIPRDGTKATCVPYNALAALAGDHANTSEELLKLLSADRGSLARSITGAAAIEWEEYRQTATPATLRVWTTVPRSATTSLNGGSVGMNQPTTDPRQFVRRLDLRLAVVDHDYASRAQGSMAHFQHVGGNMPELLQALVSTGDAENALGQVLAHHIRSLQLAVKARGLGAPAERGRARAEALLEHAFALHFLQDAFASGHIATDQGIGNTVERKRRHDYFNRQGLAVAKALARRSCVSLEEGALNADDSCWTAHGDGFATWIDRLYVIEATARVQMQFALAVDPLMGQRLLSDCPEWKDDAPADRIEGVSVASLNSCALYRAAALLDPSPPWSLLAPQGPAWTKRSRAEAVLRGALEALKQLSGTSTGVPVSSGVGAGAQRGALAGEVLGRPLALLCGPWDASLTNTDVDQACSDGGAQRGSADSRAGTPAGIEKHVPLGRPDISLWRPLLAGWPVAPADPTTVEGSDRFGKGLAWQVFIGLGLADRGVADPLSGSDGLGKGFLGGGALGVGLSYRLDNILAGHAGSWALAELNTGGGALAFPGTAQQGTFAWVAEGRAPVPFLIGMAVAYVGKYPGLVDLLLQPVQIGPNGIRVYFIGNAQQAIPIAWDVEALNWALPIAAAASESGFLPSELRLRLGASRLDGNVPNLLGSNRFTIGIEFASGYSHFL